MILLALLTASLALFRLTSTEQLTLEAAKLRSSGPYGRRSTGSQSSSNYDIPYGRQNQRNIGQQSFSNNNYNNGQQHQQQQQQQQQNGGHILGDLYSNHKFNDHQDNWAGSSSSNSGSNSMNRVQQNPSFGNSNSGSFNGFGFDIDKTAISASGGHVDRTVFDTYRNPNSKRMEQLLNLYRDHPEEFRRRAGTGEFADVLEWSGIRRSDNEMLGSSYAGSLGNSSSKSLDVYSVLAIGMFTAFIAYVVYFFITMSAEGGEGRQNLSREAQAVLGILDDVTNAFERWAVFEYLPESLSDLDVLKVLRGS